MIAWNLQTLSFIFCECGQNVELNSWVIFKNVFNKTEIVLACLDEKIFLWVGSYAWKKKKNLVFWCLWCLTLQYYNFFHLVLWNDIYSNSTTKEEKMCEKLLCCFMLPVGTIALAGISTWQNPLISPHKTTSYIPQGYYSNWVTLISLYIVLLPLQSCLSYSA